MSSYCLSERFNDTIKYTDKKPVLMSEVSKRIPNMLFKLALLKLEETL